MAEVNAMNDLELVLDRMSSEYPALVMETFLSIGMNEISDDSTALADGFCWMVSKHSIFVWSIGTEGSSYKGTVQLPLPPSGLPYSAKSVVVYKNGRGRPPGVLVVSGEGVARHFPSLTSSVHDETVIELASEVTLSVQFLESSAKEASFILTTTSGSVFSLDVCTTMARGEIQWARVGSRESRGIGRRLSNIIFGSQATPHDSSRVINSLIYRGDSEGEDYVGYDPVEPIVLTISPSTISSFDLSNKSASKTISIRSELERRVSSYFERASRGRPVAGLNMWFLDAAKFRDGILLLLAGTHDNITDVTFFLAVTHLNQARAEVEWLSAIPIGTKYAKNFEAINESSFVGHVFLCVPGQTANSPTCERTDGVVIIYPNFVQSVFLPDRLERRSELLLNKVTPIPTGTRLVGHACDERFCYVMTFDGAISCVRLLPKGFDDDLSNDNTFIEELSSLRDGSSQYDESLSLFVKAFILFATKNILEACHVMKPLLCKSDNDLTSLVYTFLKHVIDQPVGSQPEKGLYKKRIVCNRTVLFLNHIGIYDRIAPTKVLISSLSNSRTGSSILIEMTERVAVAIALWQWECIREDRAEIMEQIIKRLEHISSVPYGCESTIYSSLSIIHFLPTACIETMQELMRRAVDKEAKQRLVQLCADLLLTFVNAVETHRRNVPVVSAVESQWTTGTISDAYFLACKILLKELQGKGLSQAQRSQLRDYVVRLARFHLSECNETIDGHEVIVALYDLGECEDFKVLVKVCLELDDEERRARLNAYKRRYVAEEFDMYLCRYLKQKKLNQMLLEEKGERVDRYLLSCEGIRWRRELQNNQFEQVSRSLLSLANRETSDVYRQRSFFAFSKLAAACSENIPEDVVQDANRKLLLLKHQSFIPESLVKTVYPDDPKRPLTIGEMIELNMLDADVVEGHRRALYLLAGLLKDGDSSELRSFLTNVWTSVVKHCDWKQVNQISEIADTPFGGVLKKMVEDENPPDTLVLVLPPCEAVLEACRRTLSVNEFASKWIRGAVERASSAVESAFHNKKNEELKRSNAILSIPESSSVFRDRPLPCMDTSEAIPA
ncbi:N-terminal like protein [Ancylostoma caninum]|uniref:N-terminal like protein n=1 Tax=Ancylostoma caninum TaxID=29170 RepID=A0A368GHM4_ANCCA|nr:N-terminal like protein [Ancylostoma caninum]